MTHRERFRTVLRRRVPDRIPMVTRLDIWYAAASRDGTLPPECRGLSIHEIESRLGMGRSARFRDFHKLVFDGVKIMERPDGPRVHTELTVGRRMLRKTLTRSPGQYQHVMRRRVTEYYLKSAEDYATMTALWQNARWEVDHAAFDKFDRDVGDAGPPVMILGPGPIHKIMIDYAGYENFYLHLADFPEKVEGLLRVMGDRYKELWREAAKSSAELVLHGAHWSGHMTPAPVFRKYFLPYFSRFTEVMHKAGKQCVFHADADLAGLVNLVGDTGMDVADCFACAPLVRLELREARRVWGDRVVIWGGVPSTILLPSCPEAEFRRYLGDFLAEVADGRAVIVGVSDNVMPDTDYARLAEVARRVREIDLPTRA